MKIIKFKKTGLYFDGNGFNANSIQGAKMVSDAVELEDVALVWCGQSTDFELISTSDHRYKSVDEVRRYVRDNGGHATSGWSHRTLSVLTPSGKYISRKVMVPARSAEPCWIKYQGAEVALSWEGVLCF